MFYLTLAPGNIGVAIFALSFKTGYIVLAASHQLLLISTCE